MRVRTADRRGSDRARSRSSPRRSASTRSRAAPRRRRSPPTSSASSTARATGQYGVEGHWQDAARRRAQGDRRPARRDRPTEPRDADDRRPGQRRASTSRLTIDASLQLALEHEVYAAWVADRAKSVSAVVMDPGPARSSPRRPPRPTTPTTTGRSPRRPSSGSSTRSSAGLRAGLGLQDADRRRGARGRRREPHDEGQRPGTLQLDGGKTNVRRPDGGTGWLTFEDAVAWSRNVGVAKVALRLGTSLGGSSSVLYDTWARLGFGSRTGVDLAGEVGGIVRRPGQATVAPDRRRQRLVRPGRRGDAAPARDRLQRDGQRRHRSSSRTSSPDRRPERSVRRRGPRASCRPRCRSR